MMRAIVCTLFAVLWPGMGPPPASASDERGPAPSLPEGERIRVADLVLALETIAQDLETSETVREDYDALVAKHRLKDTDELFREYVRVRLVFESARDGGLWRLRWDITNEQPNSDRIWAQWKRVADPDPERATAVAECDELSALFAHLAHRLGVAHVGLFWPQWNHVVAVWTVQGEDGPVRIVVPTSQIFLDDDATLGTDGFDPGKQKRIYDYRRKDAKDSLALPAELVRFMIEQSWAHAGRSHAELQRERNERSRALGGS
ncbi:MAG TPA: hypothetical protein VG755_37000 [Nannocystaceae bacterium]|nr:hypothetical protein [Nannocystaceae bacterium]